jgi:hypothetical protein
MKTKFLLAVIILTASLSLAFSPESTPAGDGNGEGLSTQKIVVNNYYYLNGYEYASRIKRFHRSYVTFDFYSPLFTEIYWYRYRPYTWGVSIYDDWYYYGSVATRNAWRSGFGGSYWWGYDPWRDYSPWTGYGWSSWYSPGVSFSVNFYLGRPYYHYPMAWNRWHHQNYWSYRAPVNIINHNTYNYYYGSQKRNSQPGTAAGYNPSHPYSTEHRPGYTVSGGRSSVSRSSPPVSSGGRTQTDNSRSTGSVRTGTDRGNTTSATGNRSDRDNSNNGLRMGQYRRGVAQPADPDDNGLPRTNNPNVNDRTNPGRDQGNSTNPSGQQGNKAGSSGRQNTVTQGNRRQPTGVSIPGGNRENASLSQPDSREHTAADRAPVRPAQRQQTQSTVRTTTQRSVPARRQNKAETSSGTRQTVKQNKKDTPKSTTGKSDESGKSSTAKRRNR